MNAYAVAIDIAVGGNARAEARALTVQFELLEKVLLNIERVMATFRGPGAGIARSGASAATEWNRAAVAIERAGVAAKVTARETRAAHGGMAALIGGYVSFEGAKSAFNAQAKVLQAQTSLRINGFTKEQAAQGNKAAIAVQETNTGVSQVDALDILKTLQSITQKPDLAIAGLAATAKFAPIFQTLGLDVSKAIEAGLKGAEFRGELTAKNADGKEVFAQKSVDAFMETAANMAILSQGKIGPEQLLTFLRQSGNAGAFSTREGLGAMLPILQSLNPSQAGTAMQAMDQQFSSGKMSDGGYRLGVEMGIFSSNPALARKVGMGQRQLLPGAMNADAQALERNDKTAFVLDYLRPRIEAYNRKMYGKTYTKGASEADDKRRLAMDAATAQQLASRIPGGKGIGDILRNAPQIERDRQAMAERMKAGSPADIAITENPEVQVKAFTAAWTAFEAAWGAAIIGPVTEGLKAMTNALNAMSDWTRANPRTAAILAETAAGLVALSAGVWALGKAVGAVKTIVGLAEAGAGTTAGRSLLGRGGPLLGVFGVPGAAVALGVGAAIDAGLDPEYATKETARQLASGRASAAASRASPQSSGFVPADGYGVDGRPIQMQGTLNVDGNKLGTFLAKGITGAAGMTGHDPRMTPAPTGATGAN